MSHINSPKTILITFFLLFFVGNFYAQEYPQLPAVIPPAPNAAALGKYVENPVSLSSGIPQISIPIYTVKEGALKVPISLSYHAGGIKVEEIASWVGLGWSLNAGGVVSRTVQGLPDDRPDGYMYTSRTVKALADLSMVDREPELHELKAGHRDYEPDIFFFRFGQYSGRFIYDQLSDSFIQTPFSNILIETVKDTVDGRIESFIITTPDGVKYYFGNSPGNEQDAYDVAMGAQSISYRESFSLGTTGTNSITSWHLVEIIAPEGDNIEFNYTTQVSLNSQYTKTQESFMASPLNPGCDIIGYSASFSTSTLNVSLLQNIVFSNGAVEFILDTNYRKDLEGTKALSKIEIHGNNGLFKGFDLSQEYFISPVESGRWLSVGNPEERRYRLKLVSLTETAGQNYLPPYKFTYSSHSLPGRFSNAQDYWGYFNGKVTNESLVPKTKINEEPAVYAGNADRTVDTIVSQAGILKKIEYPTGGSEEFIYESNKVSVHYGGGVLANMENRTENRYFSANKSNVTYSQLPSQYESEIFTIGAEKVGLVQITSFVTGCDNSQSLANFDCDFLLEIHGITDPNFNLLITDPDFEFNLESGDYQVVVKPNMGSVEGDFGVTIQWQVPIEGSEVNLVGGQRIQKIITRDALGGVIEKNYEYNFFGEDLSSGYLISTPIFVNSEFYNSSCDDNLFIYNVTSYSQSPLVNTAGGYANYEEVTLLKDNLIKTEFNFSKIGDYSNFSSGTEGQINLPPVYMDWLRGNLLFKTEYKYEGGIYQPVRKTEYQYTTAYRKEISDAGLKLLPTIGQGGYTYGFYSALSEYLRKSKTITTYFFPEGDVVKEVEFLFGNNPLLPSRKIESSSKAGPVITNYYYPFDVGSSGEVGTAIPLSLSSTAISANNEMLLNHIISDPIQVEVSKDHAKIVTRDNHRLSNGKILKDNLQFSKGDEDLQTIIEYGVFNDQNKPMEVSRKDGPSTVYFWGYGGNFPIAKIENSTIDEIANALPDTTIQMLKQFDENDLDKLGDLRKSLPNAMITTYTYNPLIGTTRISDANGDNMYYIYDEFGRLEMIKDNDEHVTTEYKYGYKRSSN